MGMTRNFRKTVSWTSEEVQWIVFQVERSFESNFALDHKFKREDAPLCDEMHWMPSGKDLDKFMRSW